ncbi:hypothetical protein B0H16DRAFT_1653629 [Mycena metata]|uniref:Nephrocystin 3-like N-terminal domain-containing protein n=1 Tax=Mycena metata TaxID=1033252 RepID=A0AAD7DJJ1_9AGAR|nr:hypothetical protein B0H16DRAFT_1653629 [Mycena metata]
MSGPPFRPRTSNIHQIINGGRGGDGGTAYVHGGSGGTGEAPVQNYDINARTFNMHISMQDPRPHNASFGTSSMQEWETGPARTLHHGMGARQRPYDISARPRPLPTGPHSESSSSRSSDMLPVMPQSDGCYYANNPSTGEIPLISRQDHIMNYHSHADSDHGAQSRDDSTRFAGHHQYFQGNPPPSNRGPSITVNHHREAGLQILHRAVAWEALYDFAELFEQPKCHPETRTELLENLYNWAIDPSSEYPIHWLHGPAGAGKSAIMQTLCGRLQEAGRLGATFFFKRGHSTCGNAKMLFATLGYQLALHRHELKAPISQSIERDPSILHRRMDVQLRNLILEPYKLAHGASPSVLLIDGLDECYEHKIQQEILRLIGFATNEHHPALRILVASRPEVHIRKTFEEECLKGVADSTNIDQSFEDVRTYLRDEFSRIHREHSAMKKFPAPWPPPEILQQLVRKSSGYFVYAATIIKFVEDEYSWPSKQLDIVVQNLIPQDSESPFVTLDQLYIQILSTVPVQYHPTLCDILCVITHGPGFWFLEDIDVLLGRRLGTAELIIRPLHSVLKLPDPDVRPLEVHHASFRDFLKDETRSSSFYVGSVEHKERVGQLILKAVAYTYDDPLKNLADITLYKYVERHSHSKPTLILQHLAVS